MLPRQVRRGSSPTIFWIHPLTLPVTPFSSPSTHLDWLFCSLPGKFITKSRLSKCVLSLWGHCRERPFGAWRGESCLEQSQNSHFRCSWTQGRSCIGCKPPPWVRTWQRNALGPIEGADFVRGFLCFQQYAAPVDGLELSGSVYGPAS